MMSRREPECHISVRENRNLNEHDRVRSNNGRLKSREGVFLKDEEASTRADRTKPRRSAGVGKD
jgi:hypothetical protein